MTKPLASSVKGLQLMMDKMQETVDGYGMRINVKRTRVMNSRSFFKNRPSTILGALLHRTDPVREILDQE